RSSRSLHVVPLASSRGAFRPASRAPAALSRTDTLLTSLNVAESVGAAPASLRYAAFRSCGVNRSPGRQSARSARTLHGRASSLAAALSLSVADFGKRVIVAPHPPHGGFQLPLNIARRDYAQRPICTARRAQVVVSN